MGINWGLEVINRYESNVCNTGLRVSASLRPHCTLHFCMNLSRTDSAHELSMQTCMCIGQQELHLSCIDSKQLAHMLCHNHLFARLASCCLIVHCCSIFTPPPSSTHYCSCLGTSLLGCISNARRQPLCVMHSARCSSRAVLFSPSASLSFALSSFATLSFTLRPLMPPAAHPLLHAFPQLLAAAICAMHGLF